jgi:immunity protein Imm1 of predicted polymorphic toxin system
MFDPSDDRVISINAPDVEDVEQLIHRALTLKSGRGHPAVELTRPDGACLSIGTDGDRAVLVWVNALDERSHTVSNGKGKNLIFDYFGSWSEVPAEFTVSLSDALDGIRRFLEIGVPESEALRFELD